jgi:CNT family concentrative nucleoside transporter
MMSSEPSATLSARTLRLIAAALAAGIPAAAWLLRDVIGLRGQAAAGAVCFISIVAVLCPDLRRVNWRTVLWGVALQVGFALLILKLEVAGERPGYELFAAIARGVARFLEFSDAGALFVFGVLADQTRMGEIFGSDNGLVFAFRVLPTIVFVSSFFGVLYHLGALQLVVRLMARAMMGLMRTSGAETLAASANVFIGGTEAPLIVRPFVSRMTESELLALMVGGMATIAGGVMAVYIAIGADPIAILTTSVMAAPCGLYLSKLLLPEIERPATIGSAVITVERTHVNAIDAAAAGASQGMKLAINVAAMLIAFLAFIALIDFLLGSVREGLTLARVFGVVFAPVAFLMGIPPSDVGPVADLLGTKLVANEFVAFVKLTTEYRDVISERSSVLAAYALTSFANVASIGIQLGGIGAIAPERRHDLARLAGRALLAGSLATLINACLAAMLI